MEDEKLIQDSEFDQINRLYDECLNYLKNYHDVELTGKDKIINENIEDPDYESIKDQPKENGGCMQNAFYEPKMDYKIENEVQGEIGGSLKSERLRKLSQQLPKIIITQSNTSLDLKEGNTTLEDLVAAAGYVKKSQINHAKKCPPLRRGGYGEFPKRLVSKSGLENVALISNVPFERIRLLNDTFHTLINLQWRWIVMGTVVVHFAIWLVFAVFWYVTALAHYDFEPDPPNRTCVTGGTDFVNIFLASVEAQMKLQWRWIVMGTVVVHFAIWLVFAVFWYVTALAHYDFEPDPPNRTCVTGGTDFVNIFLASVEAQTTIGFGDRTIDEECPESIFLFIMQLILGTGLSGVLTCVVYAKLTRPEKLSRDGVGFSKKAVISVRDGRLCLMMRAWDLNYDHIISSEFTAHLVDTHRTKEGEMLRYYAQTLSLRQRQFLLWPVTLVHEIDEASPLYHYTPEHIANNSFEITVSLKGASLSMGTFTQSQTSYLPREVLWGHRFPSVVKYDNRKQKYVIEHKKLDATEPVDTPYISACQFYSMQEGEGPSSPPKPPGSPGSFSEKVSSFQLERSSSFRRKVQA